jgi:hypothetical protein
MASFGPLPVASLFGPAFRSYIGVIDNPWRLSGTEESDLLGNNQQHIKEMHASMERNPEGIWAPSLYDGLAQLEARGEGKKADDVVAYYRAVAAKYPNSPYAQNELREIARAYSDANRGPEAAAAYEVLLTKYPATHFRSEAYKYLYEAESGAGHAPEALKWAELWSGNAPHIEHYEALAAVALMRKAAGDISGSKRAAKETLDAVEELRAAVASGSITLTPKQKMLIGQQLAEAARIAHQLQ